MKWYKPKPSKKAIAALPGVQAVDVFLASEKAVIVLDPDRVDEAAIGRAVEGAGYSVPSATSQPSAPSAT